jgi:hypothetical protein
LNFKIELGRSAAVQGELGLAGYPALFRGGEVEVRKFYCGFELVGGVTGEKDQRHMNSMTSTRSIAVPYENGLLRNSKTSR